MRQKKPSYLRIAGVATAAVFGFAAIHTNTTQSHAQSNDQQAVMFSDLDDVSFETNQAFPLAPAELATIPVTPPENTIPPGKIVISSNLAPAALNKTRTSFNCTSFASQYRSRPEYVPDDSFRAAQCAQAITGTPAEFTIGIHQIECNFGQSKARDTRNPGKPCREPNTKNGCSAAGPGQFIPKTWDARNKNGKCNRKAHEIVEGNFGSLKPPAAEVGSPGYGMDCDGDGIANPWSVWDSTCATANYLGQINKSVKGDWFETFKWYNGGPKGDTSRTIPYANAVLDRANRFSSRII